MEDIQDQCPDPVPPAVTFARDLFPAWKNRFRMPKIDDNITAVNALYDTVEDIAFALDEVGVNGIFFSVLHFLDDYLLGRLCCDATESACVHFSAEAVTDLTFRVEFASFLEADLQSRFGNNFGDIFKLKNFNLSSLFTVLDFNVDFASEFFPCG